MQVETIRYYQPLPSTGTVPPLAYNLSYINGQSSWPAKWNASGSNPGISEMSICLGQDASVTSFNGPPGTAFFQMTLNTVEILVEMWVISPSGEPVRTLFNVSGTWQIGLFSPIV